LRAGRAARAFEIVVRGASPNAPPHVTTT
jgi:hypothetical protein